MARPLCGLCVSDRLRADPGGRNDANPVVATASEAESIQGPEHCRLRSPGAARCRRPWIASSQGLLAMTGWKSAHLFRCQGHPSASSASRRQHSNIACAAGLLLCPGQRLGGGIDLVVVAGVWKQHEFGEMIGQPMGGLGKMDEAVLDRRGLREEAHDLVAFVIAEGIARRSRRNEIPLGVGCFDLHQGAIAPGFASVRKCDTDGRVGMSLSREGATHE